MFSTRLVLDFSLLHSSHIDNEVEKRTTVHMQGPGVQSIENVNNDPSEPFQWLFLARSNDRTHMEHISQPEIDGKRRKVVDSGKCW